MKAVMCGNQKIFREMASQEVLIGAASVTAAHALHR
jgi:hypothetical protein